MNTLRLWIIQASTHPHGQAIGMVLLTAGFIFLYFQTMGVDLSDGGLDFRLFWESAHRVANGITPYEGLRESPYSSYLYPPVLAFLLIPLSALPFPAGGTIWFLINTAALFGVLCLTERMRRCRHRLVFPQIPYLLIFVLILLLYVPVQNHLKNGQVNLIVLFLSMASIYAYFHQRLGTAGLLLALAISIKPLPLLLLFFFLIRHAWRVVGITVLSTALLLLSPYLTMGNELFSAYQEYGYTMFYLLPTENYVKHPFHIQTSAYDFVNFFLTAHSIWLRRGINLFLFIALIILDWRRLSRQNDPGMAVLTVSLYWLITLLILPISEKHHLVLILPAVYLAGNSALHTPCNGWWSIHTGVGIFFAVFLTAKGFREAPVFSVSVMLLMGLLLSIPRSTSARQKKTASKSP